MSPKIFILGFGFTLALLAGCGNSSQPPKAKPAATAPSAANSSTNDSTQNAPSTVAVQPTSGPQAPQSQTPNVGVAPPGEVAFGPAPANSGLDPPGDAEHARMMEIRARQLQAAAQNPQPPPPPRNTNAQQH